MIPDPCHECAKRDRDQRFDDATFGGAILMAVGLGLIGSVVSPNVAVACALAGGVIGWIAGWRRFVYREAARRAP